MQLSKNIVGNRRKCLIFSFFSFIYYPCKDFCHCALVRLPCTVLVCHSLLHFNKTFKVTSISYKFSILHVESYKFLKTCILLTANALELLKSNLWFCGERLNYHLITALKLQSTTVSNPLVSVLLFLLYYVLFIK